MKRLILFTVVLFALITGPVEADPVVMGWLSIESIGFAQSVSYEPLIGDNYDLTDLGTGIAHLEGTTWVTDSWGRIVIAGHNPGAFSQIGDIQVGDLMLLIDSSGYYEQYRVSGRYPGVAIEDISWLMPTNDERLVLLACWDNERSRIVIEAVRV